MDEKRIEIDGRVYQLRPWSFKDGRRWLYRLVSLSTGAASAGSEGAAIAAIMRDLGESTFEELWATCAKYTDTVSMSEGREAVMPIEKVAEVEMRRRYIDMALIIRAHLEAEFADFFGRIADVFGGREQAKAG